MNKVLQHPSARAILTIFSLAFSARLIFFIFLKNHYFFFDYPSSDVSYYLDWAKTIAHSNWLGNDAFLGLPLYPYFLAVLYNLSLGNIFIIHIFQFLLGAFNCVLIYLIAEKLFSKKIGWASGLLTALSFSLIHYDWLLMPVTLLIFLSATIILSLLRINQSTSPKEYLCLGLLLGLASLGDGKFLIFNVLIAFYFIAKFKQRYQKNILPLFLGILIILCLSGLRNYAITHSWVWISPQSGLSFYTGNNPTAQGYYEHPDFMRPTHQGQDEDQTLIAEQTLGKKLNALEVSRFWKEQGVDFIKTRPQKYLQLLARKFQLFFTDVEEAYDIDLIFQRGYKKYWDVNTLSSIFALAFIGMIIACRRNPQSIVLIILFASQLIFTLIFFLTDRHRATILPFLIILECSALYWFKELILQKKYTRLALTVASVVAFLFLFPPQSIDPKEAAFLEYSKKGFIFQDRKDHTQAKIMLMKALTIHPSDQTSFYNLANNYYAEGDLPSAQELYEQVLKLNPTHIDAIFNLAFLYKEKGLLEDAIALFNKVIQLKETSPDAYLQIGQIYLSQKQCALAQKYLDRVMELKPQFRNEIIRLISECSN